MRMPVPRLLDRGFAADLADKIDRTRRSDLPQAPGPRGDTTLVTVVDRDRNGGLDHQFAVRLVWLGGRDRKNRHHAA